METDLPIVSLAARNAERLAARMMEGTATDADIRSYRAAAWFARERIRWGDTYRPWRDRHAF